MTHSGPTRGCTDMAVVGGLSERERAGRPGWRVRDADRAAVAARPGQLLGPCRQQLAVPPEQAAVGADDEVCVVERADADRIALVDADDDGAAMIAGGGAERGDLRTVDQ